MFFSLPTSLQRNILPINLLSFGSAIETESTVGAKNSEHLLAPGRILADMRKKKTKHNKLPLIPFSSTSPDHLFHFHMYICCSLICNMLKSFHFQAQEIKLFPKQILFLFVCLFLGLFSKPKSIYTELRH